MKFYFFLKQILPDELENHPMYKGFTDFCNTFNLTRGKNEDDEDENVIGEFKVCFFFLILMLRTNEGSKGKPEMFWLFCENGKTKFKDLHLILCT